MLSLLQLFRQQRFPYWSFGKTSRFRLLGLPAAADIVTQLHNWGKRHKKKWCWSHTPHIPAPPFHFFELETYVSLGLLFAVANGLTDLGKAGGLRRNPPGTAPYKLPFESRLHFPSTGWGHSLWSRFKVWVANSMRDRLCGTLHLNTPKSAHLLWGHCVYLITCLSVFEKQNGIHCVHVLMLKKHLFLFYVC